MGINGVFARQLQTLEKPRLCEKFEDHSSEGGSSNNPALIIGSALAGIGMVGIPQFMVSNNGLHH